MNDTGTPTLANSNELWKVKLSTRDEFQLNGIQFSELRRRMEGGDLGIVNLGDEGGFKISQIVCWWLESRQLKNQLGAGEKQYELSEEEREKGRAKVAEIREKYNLTK